jgi:hypothetical protein
VEFASLKAVLRGSEEELELFRVSELGEEKVFFGLPTWVIVEDYRIDFLGDSGIVFSLSGLFLRLLI